MKIRKNLKRGFTLVETMIAIGILAGAGFTMAGTLMTSLRSSSSATTRAIAHDIAVGYAEQIIAQPYQNLLNSLLRNDSVTLRSASLDPAADRTNDDVFFFGVPVQKDIVIKVKEDDGQLRTTSMPVEITINARDMRGDAVPYQALEMVIDYRYQPPAVGGGRDGSILSDKVHFIKSVLEQR